MCKFEIFYFREAEVIAKEHQLMLADSLSYVSNPLNAFVLIKRLSLDITQMKERIIRDANKFTTDTALIKLPMTEFQGAVEGLARLQITYGLKTEDLAKGFIQNIKYRDEMTVDELIALGVEMVNVGPYSLSVSYLKLARERNKETNEMPDIEILEKIFQILKRGRKMKVALEIVENMIEIAPERNDLLERRIEIEFDLLFSKEKPAEEAPSFKADPIYVSKLLIEACREPLKQTAAELSKLHCRLISKSDFSKLAPFKVEQANLDPYIAIFHDVISDQEVQAFKSLSRPTLHRATVFKKDAKTKVFFAIPESFHLTLTYIF